MALLTFNSHEARTVAAIAERLFPADESGPGATEIGVLNYIDQALAGAYDDAVETYRLGLAALDRLAHARYRAPFADRPPEQQDALLADMGRGTLPDMRAVAAGVLRVAARPHPGGTVRRPAVRRQPRQARLEGARLPRRLPGKFGRGEAGVGAHYEGRRNSK